jgi:hypothetical protein
MYQRWRDLTFLHFSAEPATIQKVLPSGLSVDTYPDGCGKEMAWVGLVPFRMEGVRPRRAPSVRVCSDFPETNVRTYVHREGRDPGVWFFSLDASNKLACRVARKQFSLPYHWSRMGCERNGDRVVYESAGLERPGADLRLRIQVGKEIETPQAGSLDFFLIERYLLYSVRNGSFFAGRVAHAPYPLHAMKVLQSTESLVSSAGLEPQAWTHQVFSPGVDVEVFGLRELGPV